MQCSGSSVTLMWSPGAPCGPCLPVGERRATSRCREACDQQWVGATSRAGRSSSRTNRTTWTGETRSGQHRDALARLGAKRVWSRSPGSVPRVKNGSVDAEPQVHCPPTTGPRTAATALASDPFQTHRPHLPQAASKLDRGRLLRPPPAATPAPNAPPSGAGPCVPRPHTASRGGCVTRPAREGALCCNARCSHGTVPGFDMRSPVRTLPSYRNRTPCVNCLSSLGPTVRDPDGQWN